MIETLFSLDRQLFLYINSWHLPWLNSLMVFLSGQVIWAPFVIIVLYLAHKKFNTKMFALFILFLVMTIIASDVTSSYIIKNLFQRLRPCRELELRPLIYYFGQKCGGKFGLVSSHAANSFSIFIFTWLVLGKKSKKIFSLILLPILVSYSRIYLGVHYPGDILGGFLVGLTWAGLFSYFYKKISLRSEPA